MKEAGHLAVCLRSGETAISFFKKFCFQHLNPILHGLLEIRYHMGGGDQIDPPYQNLSNQIKLDENACFGKNE